MERIGLRAAPRLTLEALKEALKGFRLPEAKVYLVTDWQDRREKARYALLLHGGKKDLLTPDAFGPAFPGGRRPWPSWWPTSSREGRGGFMKPWSPPGR